MDAMRNLGVLVCIALVCLGCDTSKSIAIAGGKVEVYEAYPKNEAGNKIVAVLRPGETVTVLATRHSKEFMFYKVRLSDRREGYIMFGDDFKVQEPK